MHSRSHKFHIEGGKAPGKTSLFGSNPAFTFRAGSYEEMMEWWNDAKQLSKVYLSAFLLGVAAQTNF
jgi:hypothetical protein